MLSDTGSATGYLEANAFAYYTYFSKPGNNTLIFFISDNNLRCMNLYLSILENPGPNNNLLKVFGSNELIYQHNGPAIKYFLGVEATKSCDYAVSVLQLDSSIHRLERGRQNMLKLLKGEVRYFTFEQYSDQPFKIISISKFGDIKLYLNQSSKTPNKKTWTLEELNKDQF